MSGTPGPADAAPEPGWIDPEVEQEFPELALRYSTVEAASGRSSPDAVKERMRLLSSRFHGARVVNLRQQPIPWAYRVFFRHIGLDPDETLTPVEEVALARLRHGRFKSVSHLDDALTVAIIETGVALRAFDSDQLEGRLGIRLSAEGERLEGRAMDLVPGTIVIADEARPVAFLFGDAAEGRGVSPKTSRITLTALQVKGVSDVAVEEALWEAASLMLARD